ncbi:protein RALF-like 32 [Mangifera indica]|uniref:protein RALF-like 32 n=1 Tax=Mangifera indica TaxID=29780 RepID=UPI001CFB1972|nr:protein RALF-like 32 [Mangifera indica]
MATKPKFLNLHLHLSTCLLLLLLLLTKAVTTTTTTTTKSNICNNSIAECDEDVEMLMESEIARRVLAQKKYITPGALKPDQPVCNSGGRGEAYSKTGGCLPPPSNPEDRGCSAYYHCRSSS